MKRFDLSFYQGKRVLVTGHTGFKGTWLIQILKELGAEVAGYALAPENEENLYDIVEAGDGVDSVIGDIRDFSKLKETFDEFRPEIVFHLAAQPIVRESYREPRYTYETNVMGTVNVCECVRLSDTVKSFVNVTTDKVYENNESGQPFKENEKLDGYDPYSNSKSCSELVTHSYRAAFLADRHIAVSCMRAGNVIGGGDFAKDRIIPDCVRAAMNNTAVCLRNPDSVRPYQHVLEPLYAYLVVAMLQYKDISVSSEYNVGPDGEKATTGEIAKIFCNAWGDGMSYDYKPDNGPHEAGLLCLDCGKLAKLGIVPRWNIEKAVIKSAEWYKAYVRGNDVRQLMKRQIEEYIYE